MHKESMFLLLFWAVMLILALIRGFFNDTFIKLFRGPVVKSERITDFMILRAHRSHLLEKGTVSDPRPQF